MPRRCRHRWGAYRVRNVESSINVDEVVYLPVKGLQGATIADYIELYDYEIEALALVHYHGLTTDEAAMRMNLSKTTFWRVLEQARFKVVKALLEQKPIRVVSSKQSSQEINLEEKKEGFS